MFLKGLLAVVAVYDNSRRNERAGKTKDDVSDSFTSENMENMSLVSRMYFLMKSTSGLFYSKTLIPR